MLADRTETYTFYTQTDDGVRLWVNGVRLINDWTDHGIVENRGSIALVAGRKYDLLMEYYDNGGGAFAKLLWSSAGTPKAVIPADHLFQPTTGLTGNYFAGITLTGPAHTRNDATVNFNWGNGFGDPNVGSDLFSVRWTGRITPPFSETYRFYANSDDGVRLWVNNILLVDNWTDHGPDRKQRHHHPDRRSPLRHQNGVLREGRQRPDPIAVVEPVDPQADHPAGTPDSGPRSGAATDRLTFRLSGAWHLLRRSSELAASLSPGRRPIQR